MDLKLMRKIHLYLGCFFAPLLIFFIVSGCLQTFQFHRTKKDGSYRAPTAITKIAEIHMRQRVRVRPWEDNKLFQVFVLLMSLGLLATVVLGVVMAFKHTNNYFLIWLCLGAGVVIPFLMLWFHQLK